MKYKAVLFDLDGTLLDTIEDLTDSMNMALAKMGFPGKSVEESKQLVGDGLDTFVRRVLPSGVSEDPEVGEELKELMRTEYKKRNAVKTRPYEGIPELLDALREREIPTAVLSNKPNDATLAVMKIYFSRWEFRAIQGARDGFPVKPDPSAALEIVRLLGVKPYEIVYVGDTNTDMQTANAAGMYAVGALWGFRTAEELKSNGAKALIEKPLDLLPLLA